MSLIDNDVGGNQSLAAVREVPAPDGEIILWLCPLDIPAAELAACGALLSASERARAARFGTALLHRRYVAGRGTLRMLLGRELGVAPSAVPIGRGPRGRPMLTSTDRMLDFNVTHTREVALIALLRASHVDARIGIDIEHEERQVGADRLARRYLTARERECLANLDADARRRRFIRLWTAKEAMSKATGDGLAAPMGRLDIDLADGPRLLTGPPPYTPAAWRLADVPLADGFIATIARWNGTASA